METPCFLQCAKKVVSSSPGLVDFTIGLVIFVLYLSDGQVLFFSFFCRGGGGGGGGAEFKLQKDCNQSC